MHASFLLSVFHPLHAYITALGGVGLATPCSKADGFQLESFLRQGESVLPQLIIQLIMDGVLRVSVGMGEGHWWRSQSEGRRVCEPLEETWLSAIPSPEAAGWERREGVILFPVSRPCVLSVEKQKVCFLGSEKQS